MKLRGRAVSPGHAAGSALVSRNPLSFLGGVSLDRGIISDPASDVFGESVAGRVLAFPHGKGSTIGSYVLYGIAKRGLGPAAIVNEKADTVVASGAILAETPMVDRIDLDALATGDRVFVDANAGTIEIPEVEERHVVTAFLRHRGRVLVVRRSDRVGSFRGKWSAISGYLERGEEPRDRAMVEIREETGLRSVRFRKAGELVRGRDAKTAYVVHPFLFDSSRRIVRLDWENVESRWIRPEEIKALDAVPRLEKALLSVLSPSPPRARSASLL